MELNAMTDEELSDLIDDASGLLARRQTLAAVDRQVGEVLRTARTEGVTETPVEGKAWVQPTSAVDAYLQGDVVTHGGKTWAALMNYAVHEPGVSGWREVPGEDDDGNPVVPEYVAPTGSHDAYMTGDQVTFEGSTWESVIDNNTWSPADYPQGWKEV